jgi:hypothetical protein
MRSLARGHNFSKKRLINQYKRMYKASGFTTGLHLFLGKSKNCTQKRVVD